MIKNGKKHQQHLCEHIAAASKGDGTETAQSVAHSVKSGIAAAAEDQGAQHGERKSESRNKETLFP